MSGAPKAFPTPGWARPTTILALAVFSLAIALTHADVWLAGAREVVPTGRFEPIPARMLGSGERDAATDLYNLLAGVVQAQRDDALFEAWLVSRNADTLVRHPSRLFDGEHCAPAKKTVTLGVPMITMGILGIPAQLVTGDPILTYNVAIAVMALVAAFAMYALLTTWTGVASAGIVAGLLYALHPVRLIHISHPAEWDTAWTVLAFLFAYRLFAFGRWRDAFGLAVAGALQMAATFYQLVGALFLALPFALWLLLSFGLTRQRLVQLAFVAVALAVAASAIYGPYLEARADSQELLRRSFFYYAAWPDYLPSGRVFPGWVPIALALVGVAANRRRALASPQRDPRWAIAAGGLLTAAMAAGYYNNELLYLIWKRPPFTIPDPYAALAGVLPGLDTVRVVFRLSAGVILALCIMAGFGAAALVRVAGRSRPLVAFGLIALATAAVVRPEVLGSPQSHGWLLHRVRPDPADIRFFEELAARGNTGPILELPFRPDTGLGVNPERILLTAYHHRRTSACYGSFSPPEEVLVATLAARLPDPAAVSELRALGFTTVVVHEGDAVGAGILNQLSDGESLRMVDANESLAALELRPLPPEVATQQHGDEPKGTDDH